MGALTQARSMKKDKPMRWVGWMGGFGIKAPPFGFHQTLVSSRLPQAFVDLANKECHCVLPACSSDEDCKIESSP